MALGGALGSALRFVVSGLVHGVFPFALFPWGTLVVNALGCLAIGFLAGLAEIRSVLGPEARVFVLIGILGGFTTFSTFAYETFALAQDSDFFKASFNIIAQVVLGLGFAWLGYGLARVLGGA